MIIETILNALTGVIKIALGWINLPNFPETLRNSIDQFLSLIFNNLSAIGLFIDVNTIKICVPILIAIINFDKLYKLTMWILRKIPGLSIK